jgi:phage terminase large subunit GpA-like protein
MSFQFRKSAASIFGRAIAEALRPADQISPSEWAASNLIVPDGPSAGQSFDLAMTPYLREPLDMLGPDSPVNEIAIRKSAQSGFTLLLIAAVGFMIDQAPCQILLIQPTSDALSDFNRLKLDPVISVSPALRRKVAVRTSRSSTGSTMHNKAFAGGALTLAIASSAADLRSKTVRVLLRDEIDQYADDLDGQGSPLEISDGRLISFLASGEWKKADVSTPTIKGISKIERRYEAGDQRRWHVPCPGCGDEFSFEWGENFRFETTWPFKAHYVAPCCGTIIESGDKNSLVRKGRWIASASRPGAFPSYHFDALSSPFVPWAKIAAEHVAAGDDAARLKTFTNLWLGMPFELKGDAPSIEILMLRREEGLDRGRIPPRGLLLVASADVQAQGIWVEVIAVDRTRETWVVEAMFLSGATESPDGDAFTALRERVLDRDWPDAFGRTRKLDALAVDTGYRAQCVYSWARANQRTNPMTRGAHLVIPVKGSHGWDRPACGLPTPVDINFEGKRVRHGAKVRAVGIDGLKAVFMDDLAKEGIKSGKPSNPEGYCHFPDWLDETYFKQLTAEYCDEEMYRGRTKRVWKQRYRDNHFLDCRVYNLALLAFLGRDKLEPEDWYELERQRGAPAGAPQQQELEPSEAVATAPPAGGKIGWREMMAKRKADG